MSLWSGIAPTQGSAEGRGIRGSRSGDGGPRTQCSARGMAHKQGTGPIEQSRGARGRGIRQDLVRIRRSSRCGSGEAQHAGADGGEILAGAGGPRCWTWCRICRMASGWVTSAMTHNRAPHDGPNREPEQGDVDLEDTLESRCPRERRGRHAGGGFRRLMSGRTRIPVTVRVWPGLALCPRGRCVVGTMNRGQRRRGNG